MSQFDITSLTSGGMKLIVIAAPITTRSGYGDRARDLCRQLLKQIKEQQLLWEVKIVATPWGNTPITALDPSDELASYLCDPHSIMVKPDLHVQITIPSEFKPFGVINVGITAGIETDTCPADWKEPCDKMDLILVSSEHSKAGIQQITNTRCEVLFEGVNAKGVLKPTDLTELLDKIREQCFLVVGHWLSGTLGEDRKNIGLLIRRFLAHFANKPVSKRPGLILKVSGAGFSEIELDIILNKIEQIKQQVCEELEKEVLPNIYIIHGDLTDNQMVELYRHNKVTAMVSLAKGEGFGRPLLEFYKNTNKPIVASNWSGPLDFLTHKGKPLPGCRLVRGELTHPHISAQNKWITPESKWFSPYFSDIDNAFEELYKEKTVRAPRKGWSEDEMGQLFIKYLQTVI